MTLSELIVIAQKKRFYADCEEDYNFYNQILQLLYKWQEDLSRYDRRNW